MGERSSFRTWLSFTGHEPPDVGRVTFRTRHVAHMFLYLHEGSFRGRYICRGKEFAADGEAGTVRFDAADGEEHVLTGGVGSRGMQYTTLMIPADDLHLMSVADELTRLPDPRPMAWPNDSMLRACLDVLVRTGDAGPAEEERDESARSLVLRVAELLGAKMPEWRSDQSGFTNRTLGNLVDYVDARLQSGVLAGDMALVVGLSPSHFARKFRRSVGMPLHRFVMRRRIQASLAAIKDQSRPIAHVAVELGFSSQSHFTRVFSDLTGMTPAKYRKQFRSTVG